MSLKQEFQERTISDITEIKDNVNWEKRVARRPIGLDQRDRNICSVRFTMG